MAFMRYALPALAVASSAYAASVASSCSVSGTTTISAVADAPTSCPTFDGSISVTSDASGDLVLDGITEITGSLLIPNAANLSTISGSTLQSIGGTFEIQIATILDTLSFPELTSVQDLTWITLGPNLQQISAALDTVQALNIRDTYLQNLDGITLKTAQSIYIAQNGYLTSIDLPLTSVSGELTLQSNADGKTVATFANLTTAGTIDIRNCSSVILTKLANVTDSFSVTGNTFTSLSLPALTTSDGFSVDNNNDMTSISAPVYKTSTGAFSFQNNTAFDGTVEFADLTTVKGAAIFKGDFTAVKLPDLNSVLGAMTIVSTKDIDSTCTHFESIDGENSVIEGTITCDGASATSSSSSSSSSSTSSSSSSTSSSAAMGQYAAAPVTAFTVFGGLAALFGYLEMFL